MKNQHLYLPNTRRIVSFPMRITPGDCTIEYLSGCTPFLVRDAYDLIHPDPKLSEPTVYFLCPWSESPPVDTPKQVYRFVFCHEGQTVHREARFLGACFHRPTEILYAYHLPEWVVEG